MGMDVYGKKPAGECGEYFRNNVWWWHPLADYCNMIAPDLCAPCEGWHYNDGYGLEAAGAVALAEALQKEIDAGRTEAFARRYASALLRMPDEPCRPCAGTGTRKFVPHSDEILPWDETSLPAMDDLKEGGECMHCQGTGYVRPLDSNCSFLTANVANFIAFLRESGGFVIW